MICGLIFNSDGSSIKDTSGCCLDLGHRGPHEFVDNEGVCYQWETDFECTCDHCLKCEGDYCSFYWPKK